MRTLRTSVALQLFATFLFAQAADPAELVKQGRKLNNEGKQNEAIALYQQALKASPDNYDAHLSMGVALDLQGKFKEGREHIAHAIKLANAEQKPQALRTMAMAWAFAGNGKEAEKYQQQVFDIRLSKQDYDGAAEIANEIGRILLETGDTKRARAWYHKGHENALKKADLKPNEKDLWDFRWEHAQARIAAREGKHDAAKKHVAAARAILDKGTNKEQEPYFPYLAGYVAFYGKDYKAAIIVLEKANQKDPFILVLLAQAHEKSGDAAKAKELYAKALESNAHNPANAPARPLAMKKLGKL